MEKDKSLIIWLCDGQTMKFEKVTNFKSGAHIIEFNYFGISTGVKRYATFSWDKIAGYALEKIGECENGR